jgi:acyl-CoA reductase-like NAD-dependent aldehyde dehydrogenase
VPVKSSSNLYTLNAERAVLQVRLANDTVFGLGSYVFSGSQAHANQVGGCIKSGMFVVNDYASNSMCQSLPFGGIKESGFDRWAIALVSQYHAGLLNMIGLSNSHWDSQLGSVLQWWPAK